MGVVYGMQQQYPVELNMNTNIDTNANKVGRWQY